MCIIQSSIETLKFLEQISTMREHGTRKYAKIGIEKRYSKLDEKLLKTWLFAYSATNFLGKKNKTGHGSQ